MNRRFYRVMRPSAGRVSLGIITKEDSRSLPLSRQLFRPEGEGMAAKN